MTSQMVERPETSGASAGGPAPGVLWFSFPIGLLAIGASIAGIVSDSTYARETDNWAAQAVGQDIANLVAYPLLMLLGLAAMRGSLRAYLGWTAVLGYSVYTYAIYAFDVRFGHLFIVYVAVFGLSFWALIGALIGIDAGRVRDAAHSGPARSAATLLFVIAGAFYALWLSEVAGGTVTGDPPATLRQAGLPTNPIHVLDMAVLLPAAVLAGVLLVRRHRWGYVLTPLVLGAMVLIALGIVFAMIVIRSRGGTDPLGVAIGIAVLAATELVVLVRLLAGLRPEIRLREALRRS